MPTPEQWQQYAQTQNQYRYGTPEIGAPEMGKAIGSALSAHINRPDVAGSSPFPATRGSWMGMSAPQDQAGAATPALPAPSYDNARFEDQRIAQIGARQQPQELLPYATPPTVSRSSLMSLGNGFSVSGGNTSGRAGYTNKTYYDPSGNAIASGLSSATGRGGYVGAATDAQAAIALQDRAAQNQAAQFNIDSMNRAAEAMREARAGRLGVSRGVLDRMEGRTGTEAAAADSAAQGAIPDRWFNPFALPGDSFQDTRGRQAEYDRAIDQALNGNRRQQQGAQVALQGLFNVMDTNQKDRMGLAQVGATRYEADSSRYGAEQRAMADQREAQQRGALEASRLRYERGRNRELDYWNIADKQSQIADRRAQTEERGLPKPPTLQNKQAELAALYQEAMGRIGSDPNAEKAAAFYLKMYNDLGFNRQPQDGTLTAPVRG